MRLLKVCAVVVAVALIVTTSLAIAGETLDAVKKRGYLIAGVNGGVFGFSMPDEKGVWKGLDVDTARAIATAVFGDADKIMCPSRPSSVYPPCRRKRLMCSAATPLRL